MKKTGREGSESEMKTHKHASGVESCRVRWVVGQERTLQAGSLKEERNLNT